MTRSPRSTALFSHGGLTLLADPVDGPLPEPPIVAGPPIAAPRRSADTVAAVVVLVHLGRADEAQSTLAEVARAVQQAVRGVLPEANVDVAGVPDAPLPPPQRTAPVLAGADGRLTVDLQRRSVMVDGRPAVLTNREFELLLFLLRRTGQAVSRTEIMSSVWGDTYLGGTRTLDAHVRRLRVKLGTVGDEIHTLRSYGYRFGS